MWPADVMGLPQILHVYTFLEEVPLVEVEGVELEAEVDGAEP